MKIAYWLFHWIFPRARNFYQKSKDVIEYFRLQGKGNAVEFSHDGAVRLELPPVSLADVLRSNKTIPHLSFVGAAHHEPVLRVLVSDLFTKGLLDSSKSIIDIGCWLGDNSLPWAQRLDRGATVFGIDPSENNLHFVRQVAELNGLQSVVLFDAVCSDVSGVEVGTRDDISHASFSTLPGQPVVRLTTTLDDLIPNSSISRIGLLHLDVEGMEAQVILGAKALIERSRPLIIFERHLSDEERDNPAPIVQSMGYEVFMINEVIIGNRPDCRNFFCIPQEDEACYSLLADGAFPHVAFRATEGPRLIAASIL